MFPKEAKTKGLNSSRVTVFLSQRTDTDCAPSGVEGGHVSKWQQENLKLSLRSS